MPTTATEAAVRLRAARRGPATAVVELDGSEPWLPRILGVAGGVARVALVQSRATLLGGDTVSVAVDVGEGASLELLELGATVAHDARGGPPARVAVDISLAPDARLVWRSEPLIAGAGCAVTRAIAVALAPGARILLEEALVLGRAGEEPGRVRTHTRITLAGRPVLDETLDTAPAWLRCSDAVAGGARMIGALTLAGVRDPGAPVGALQLFEPATLWRSLGPAWAGRDAAGARLAGSWRDLVLDRS